MDPQIWCLISGERKGERGVMDDSGSGMAVGQGMLCGAGEEWERGQLGGEECFVLDTRS